MYLVSCLVSGSSLGPSLCPECAGIRPKWAKQVPRVPSELSYCEYCLYLDLCLFISCVYMFRGYWREPPFVCK